MFGAFTSHVNKTLPLEPLKRVERMFINVRLVTLLQSGETTIYGKAKV